MGSHLDFNELTHGITFRNRWGWQQRSVLAIKGKTPGSKPRTFLWWAFFASCVLEVYECQSPGDSSELPGYLDTSLQAENTAARDRDDLRADRGCIARPSVSGGRSTRVQSRETMTAVCKSTTRTGTLFPTPLGDGTVTPSRAEGST
jgi:hypothetical protein